MIEEETTYVLPASAQPYYYKSLLKDGYTLVQGSQSFVTRLPSWNRVTGAWEPGSYTKHLNHGDLWICLWGYHLGHVRSDDPDSLAWGRIKYDGKQFVWLAEPKSCSPVSTFDSPNTLEDETKRVCCSVRLVAPILVDPEHPLRYEIARPEQVREIIGNFHRFSYILTSGGLKKRVDLFEVMGLE